MNNRTIKFLTWEIELSDDELKLVQGSAAFMAFFLILLRSLNKKWVKRIFKYFLAPGSIIYFLIFDSSFF